MNIKRIFDKIEEPQRYINNNRQCYFDYYRSVFLNITPEERVRQKILVYCEEYLNVPRQYIYTEEHLKHYGKTNENGRIDIVIKHDINGRIEPLAVIECKAESVPLSAQVADQSLRYADIIGADYFFITNGIEIYQYKYNPESNMYEPLNDITDYYGMIQKHGQFLDTAFNWNRMSYDELFKLHKAVEYGINYNIIGEDTPIELIPHIINISDGLLDISHRMRNLRNKYFEITDDLGVRFLKYGDTSGGNFGTGDYRVLMIKNKNGVDIRVSIGIMATGKTINDPKYKNTDGKSVLVVSVNDHQSDQMAVQINLNKFLYAANNRIVFTHNGVVTRKGAKASELRSILSEKYCIPIKNNRIILGEMKCDRLLYIDNQDFEKIIENIILYSLVRNEYKKQFH